MQGETKNRFLGRETDFYCEKNERGPTITGSRKGKKRVFMPRENLNLLGSFFWQGGSEGKASVDRRGIKKKGWRGKHRESTD